MRYIAVTTLFGTIAFGAAIAAADSDTAASAFARGRAAMRAGRVHDACDAFAQSEQLQAAAATEKSLAACYEQDGKPIAAARVYRKLASSDPHAADKAASLEAKAPRLRFAINPAPAGLVVKVDGETVDATADVPVDVGPHEVVAAAPGFAGHASAPVDRDHGTIDVIVRMQPVAESPAAPAPAPAPLAAPSPATTPEPAIAPTGPAPLALDPTEHRHRKRDAIIVGAVGVGVLVASGVLYGLAQSKFDDEHSLCPSSRCATQADLDRANSLLSDARAYRYAGIGTSVGAGALIITGVALLVLPQREEATHVSVSVDRTGGGVAYTARF